MCDSCGKRRHRRNAGLGKNVKEKGHVRREYRTLGVPEKSAMLWSPIVRLRCAGKVVPNLQDYQQARAAFSGDQARRELDGLPGEQGLNIAHEAADRHAEGPRGD